MNDNKFILFDKLSLYDEENNATIIYGQGNIKDLSIEEIEYELVFCDNRPEFYIKIIGKIIYLKFIMFILHDEIRIVYDINLEFPFLNCDISLNKNTSSIISTICKNYSHRLDEWIQYNLRLGFSGIIIFNNNSNVSNNINESLENCVEEESIENICNKYKGKVYMVNYPYSPLKGNHWNSIQRTSLNIGVNEFRNKCRNIALIDADEFIYINKNPNIKLEDFLQDYETTITMKSNILTNKNNNDILNNNILKLAHYVGEDKYTKTILKTSQIKYLEFIITPHDHPTQIILDKQIIIHYHCWMNNRYNYYKSMEKINLLK